MALKLKEERLKRYLALRDQSQIISVKNSISNEKRGDRGHDFFVPLSLRSENDEDLFL